MHPKDRADDERMAEEARMAAQKEKDAEAKLAAQKEKDAEAKLAAQTEKDAEAKRIQEAEFQEYLDKLTPEERHYWIQQLKLADEARALSEGLEDLYARVPATPAEVKQTIEAASNLRRRWSKIAGDAANLIAEASRLDVDQLAVMAANFATSNSDIPDTDATQRGVDASNPCDEGELRRKAVLDEALKSGKTRLGPLYVLANTHDKLGLAIKEIGQLQRDLYWKQANTEGREILDKAKKLRSEFPEMERLLKEKDSNGSELGLDMRFQLYKTRLDGLNRGFAAILPPAVGNPRFGDYQRMEPLVDRCRTLFKGLEEKINAGLSIQADKGMQVNKEKLDAIPKELSGAYVTTLRALEDAKTMLNKRLKKVESRPRWFYVLADLFA
jgi:hypothetical protein